MKNDLELSVSGLLKKIDELKSEIDKFHPLPQEVEDRIFQKFRLDWNFNSNAIEGNTLNYGETYAFLMHGITASGKPLKDYLDIRGHNEAINYLINLVRNKEELTEAVIRELHKVILVESYETDALTQNGKLTKKTVTLGAYKTVPNHVKTATGEVHYFASPEETPAKMDDLMKWYRKSRNDKEIHPVVLAAFFHHKFSEIHPFDDGNGRMARLIMNLILMQNNFPPAIIKIKDRNNYYLALSQADAGNSVPFIEYILEVLVHSMEIYLMGARGESIEEPDDLDKEILLLKKKIEGKKDSIRRHNTIETQYETINLSFNRLLKSIGQNIKKFEELFIEKKYMYSINKVTNNEIERSQLMKFIETDDTEMSIQQLKDTNKQAISDIIFTIRLKKLKNIGIDVNILIWISIRFKDFTFLISIKVEDSPSNVLDRNNEIAEWSETIAYDKQISDMEILNANKIIFDKIIDFIHSKTDD
jgi:Fic family protein